MINDTQRPYKCPTDLNSAETLGQALSQVPLLAYDDYMAGLVKATKNGTVNHKSRIKCGFDVLKLIGCKNWLRPHERIAMSVYNTTLMTLDENL